VVTLLNKFRALESVLQSPALPHLHRLVLGNLICHASGRGVAWPSVARLAEHAGATERGVRGALGKLAAAGLIRRETRRGRGRFNVYCIVWTAVLALRENRKNRKPVSGFAVVKTGNQLPENRKPVSAKTGSQFPIEPIKGISERTDTHTERIVTVAPSGGTRQDSEVCVSQDHEKIFERIYERHAKKDGRVLAEKAWAERLSEFPDDQHCEVASRIEGQHRRWVEYQEGEGTEPRYWPALHRWLREKRDLDNIPEPYDPFAHPYDPSKE